MHDEIMQEKWPEFEKEFKRYAEFGPFLAKVGYSETMAEAKKRLRKIVRQSKEKYFAEESKRLIFREFAIFILMLYRIRATHKEKCACSICFNFAKLLGMFFRKSSPGLGFFFDTGKAFDGDVGFRLTNVV